MLFAHPLRKTNIFFSSVRLTFGTVFSYPLLEINFVWEIVGEMCKVVIHFSVVYELTRSIIASWNKEQEIAEISSSSPHQNSIEKKVNKSLTLKIFGSFVLLHFLTKVIFRFIDIIFDYLHYTE